MRLRRLTDEEIIELNIQINILTSAGVKIANLIGKSGGSKEMDKVMRHINKIQEIKMNHDWN